MKCASYGNTNKTEKEKANMNTMIAAMPATQNIIVAKRTNVVEAGWVYASGSGLQEYLRHIGKSIITRRPTIRNKGSETGSRRNLVVVCSLGLMFRASAFRALGWGITAWKPRYWKGIRFRVWAFEGCVRALRF